MTRKFHEPEVRQLAKVHNDVEKSPVEDAELWSYYRRSRGVLEHPARPLTTTRLSGDGDG